MKNLCPRALCIVAAAFFSVYPAAAGDKRPLKAARDIRVLVPAGVVAKWPLYGFQLDEKGQPSYNIRRRFSLPGAGPQTVATLATPTRPAIPATRPVDDLSEKQEPVLLDKEVFIPAFGRKVRYYLESHGGGADNDYYATEPVAWPDGHGGTLWLVIQAESTTIPPQKLLPSVKWVRPGAIANWKTQH